METLINGAPAPVFVSTPSTKTVPSGQKYKALIDITGATSVAIIAYDGLSSDPTNGVTLRADGKWQISINCASLVQKGFTFTLRATAASGSYNDHAFLVGLETPQSAPALVGPTEGSITGLGSLGFAVGSSFVEELTTDNVVVAALTKNTNGSKLELSASFNDPLVFKAGGTLETLSGMVEFTGLSSDNFAEKLVFFDRSDVRATTDATAADVEITSNFVVTKDANGTTLLTPSVGRPAIDFNKDFTLELLTQLHTTPAPGYQGYLATATCASVANKCVLAFTLNDGYPELVVYNPVTGAVVEQFTSQSLLSESTDRNKVEYDHLAVVQAGNVLSFYHNGTLVDFTMVNWDWPDMTAEKLTVGGSLLQAVNNTYFSQLRLTEQARYLGEFAAPCYPLGVSKLAVDRHASAVMLDLDFNQDTPALAEEFGVDPHTVLLVHADARTDYDTRIVDSSAYNNPIKQSSAQHTLHAAYADADTSKAYPVEATPNVTSAFGLKRMSAYYFGHCIRVARLSDGVVKDIGFDGDALDTTTLLSFVGSDSGVVTIWYDQTGRHCHLRQPNKDKAPLIVSSGNVVFDPAMPALAFRIFNGQAGGQYFNIDSQAPTPEASYFFTASAFTAQGNPSQKGGTLLGGGVGATLLNVTNNGITVGQQSTNEYTWVPDYTPYASTYAVSVSEGVTLAAFNRKVSRQPGITPTVKVKSIGSDLVDPNRDLASFMFELIITSDFKTEDQIVEVQERAMADYHILPDYEAVPNIVSAFAPPQAVFSVRKLNQAYTGPCMLVYNPNDDTFVDVGFDRDGLLDVAVLERIAGAAELRVETWYDQSGFDRHANAIATNARAHIYWSKGLEEQGGLPALNFGKGGTCGYNLTDPVIAGQGCMAVVTRGTTGTILAGPVGAPALELTGPGSVVLKTIGVGDMVSASGTINTSNQCMAASFRVSGPAVYVNGTLTDNGTFEEPTSEISQIGYASAGVGYHNGWISEIVLCGMLETSQLKQLQLNQAAYFNVPMGVAPTTANAPGYLGLTKQAKGAYSLRKINQDYSGNCIQVYRSSDAGTTDIGFGADGWIDQASLLTFIGSGNGYVTRWYDQSNNGNTAVAYSTAAAPQIVSNGVVIARAGMPSLLFGHNTLGAGYSRFDLTTSVGYNDGNDVGCSAWAVYSGHGSVNSGTNASLMLRTNPANKRLHVLSDFNVLYDTIDGNALPELETFVASTSVGRGMLVTYNDKIRQKRNPVPIGGVTTTIGVDASDLSPSNDYIGYLTEVVLFNDALSPKQVTAVNKTLTKHYGRLTQGVLNRVTQCTSPAVKAAYSLRRARATYKGYCVTVKRSQDAASKSFGFTKEGVLDTAAILSFVSTGDGVVTKWFDQSGHDLHLVSIADNEAPFLVKAGVLVTRHGLPTLDWTATGTKRLFNYAYSPFASGVTALMAFEFATMTSAYLLEQYTNGGDYTGMPAFGVSASALSVHQVNTGSNPGATSLAINKPLVASYVSSVAGGVNNPSIEMFHNGVSVGTANPVGVGLGTTGFVLGGSGTGTASDSLNGYLSEVLIYDKVLDNTSRQALEVDMMANYAFGVGLIQPTKPGYFDKSVMFSGNSYLNAENCIPSSLSSDLSTWAFETRLYIDQTIALHTFAHLGGVVASLVGNVIRVSLNGTEHHGATKATVKLNAWHHIALVSINSKLRVYLDGALVIDAIDISGAPLTQLIYIGGAPAYASFNGYLDEVRLSVRKGRYLTAPFTPPATPFRIDRVINATAVFDKSKNAVAMTIGGNALVTAVDETDEKVMANAWVLDLPDANSFAQTNALVPLYLNDQEGVSVEFAVKFRSLAAGIILTSDTGPSLIRFETVSGPMIKVSADGAVLYTPAIVTNNWYRIALVHASGRLYLFVNGVLAASTAKATFLTEVTNLATVWRIGAVTGGVNAQVTDVRLTNASRYLRNYQATRYASSSEPALGDVYKESAVMHLVPVGVSGATAALAASPTNPAVVATLTGTAALAHTASTDNDHFINLSDNTAAVKTTFDSHAWLENDFTLEFDVGFKFNTNSVIAVLHKDGTSVLTLTRQATNVLRITSFWYTGTTATIRLKPNRRYKLGVVVRKEGDNQTLTLTVNGKVAYASAAVTAFSATTATQNAGLDFGASGKEVDYVGQYQPMCLYGVRLYPFAKHYGQDNHAVAEGSYPLLTTSVGNQGDPNYRDVTLLLKSDGAAIEDQGPYRLQAGTYGNVGFTQTNTLFNSNSSFHFDGSGSALIYPYRGFDFSQDFTIELAIRPDQMPEDTVLLSVSTEQNSEGNTEADMVLVLRKNGDLVMTNNQSVYNVGIDQTNLVVVDVWSQLAISRVGDYVYAFVNGRLTSAYAAPRTAKMLGMTHVEGAKAYLTIGRTYPANLVEGINSSEVLDASFNDVAFLDNCESGVFKNEVNTGGTVNQTGITYLTGPKFGTKALISINKEATEYVSIPSSAAFNFAKDDFSVEFWLMPFTHNSYLMHDDLDTLSGVRGAFAILDSGYPALYIGASAQQASRTIDLAKWSHLAYSRKAGVFYIHLNGEQVLATAIDSNFDLSQGTKILIGNGAYNGVPYPVNGMVDSIRITKGASRLDGTALPTPTTEFIIGASDPLWNNVTLLLDFEDTRDKSLLNNPVTLTPQLKLAAGPGKFESGSMYVGGGGCQLEILNPVYPIGSMDATIEGWFCRLNVSGGYENIFGFYNNNDACMVLRYADGGFGNHLQGIVGGSFNDIVVGFGHTKEDDRSEWHHFAFVRQNNAFYLYVDGVRVGGTVTRGESVDVNRVIIGSGFLGLINGLRITLGVARYTASFDVPLRNPTSAGYSVDFEGHYYQGALDAIRVTTGVGRLSGFKMADNAKLLDYRANNTGYYAQTVYGDASLLSTNGVPVYASPTDLYPVNAGVRAAVSTLSFEPPATLPVTIHEIDKNVFNFVEGWQASLQIDNAPYVEAVCTSNMYEVLVSDLGAGQYQLKAINIDLEWYATASKLRQGQPATLEAWIQRPEGHAQVVVNIYDSAAKTTLLVTKTFQVWTTDLVAPTNMRSSLEQQLDQVYFRVSVDGNWWKNRKSQFSPTEGTFEALVESTHGILFETTDNYTQGLAYHPHMNEISSYSVPLALRDNVLTGTFDVGDGEKNIAIGDDAGEFAITFAFIPSRSDPYAPESLSTMLQVSSELTNNVPFGIPGTVAIVEKDDGTIAVHLVDMDGTPFEFDARIAPYYVYTHAPESMNDGSTPTNQRLVVLTVIVQNGQVTLRTSDGVSEVKSADLNFTGFTAAQVGGWCSTQQEGLAPREAMAFFDIMAYKVPNNLSVVAAVEKSLKTLYGYTADIVIDDVANAAEQDVPYRESFMLYNNTLDNRVNPVVRLFDTSYFAEIGRFDLTTDENYPVTTATLSGTPSFSLTEIMDYQQNNGRGYPFLAEITATPLYNYRSINPTVLYLANTNNSGKQTALDNSVFNHVPMNDDHALIVFDRTPFLNRGCLAFDASYTLNGLRFDATDDVDWLVHAGDFTISTHALVDRLNSNQISLVKFVDSSTPELHWGLSLVRDASTNVLSAAVIVSDGVTEQTLLTVPCEAIQAYWTHLSLVKKGNNLALYVDGKAPQGPVVFPTWSPVGNVNVIVGDVMPPASGSSMTTSGQVLLLSETRISQYADTDPLKAPNTVPLTNMPFFANNYSPDRYDHYLEQTVFCNPYTNDGTTTSFWITDPEWTSLPGVSSLDWSSDTPFMVMEDGNTGLPVGYSLHASAADYAKVTQFEPSSYWQIFASDFTFEFSVKPETIQSSDLDRKYLLFFGSSSTCFAAMCLKYTVDEATAGIGLYFVSQNEGALSECFFGLVPAESWSHWRVIFKADTSEIFLSQFGQLQIEDRKPVSNLPLNSLELSFAIGAQPFELATAAGHYDGLIAGIRVTSADRRLSDALPNRPFEDFPDRKSTDNGDLNFNLAALILPGISGADDFGNGVVVRQMVDEAYTAHADPDGRTCEMRYIADRSNAPAVASPDSPYYDNPDSQAGSFDGDTYLHVATVLPDYYALKFGDDANVSKTSCLKPTSTIETWMKISSTQAWQPLFQFSNADRDSWALYLDGGILKSVVTKANASNTATLTNQVTLTSPGQFKLDKWVHVSIVKTTSGVNGGDSRLFLDGRFICAFEHTYTDYHMLTIGACNYVDFATNNTNYPFAASAGGMIGLMHEFKLYYGNLHVTDFLAPPDEVNYSETDLNEVGGRRDNYADQTLSYSSTFRLALLKPTLIDQTGATFVIGTNPDTVFTVKNTTDDYEIDRISNKEPPTIWWYQDTSGWSIESLSVDPNSFKVVGPEVDTKTRVIVRLKPLPRGQY